MIYTRYVIGPSDGASLHGNYQTVSHLWEHGDGTSIFKVTADELQFEMLNTDPLLDVLPSLNAPASAVASAKFHVLLAKNNIASAPTDTVLNSLRKLRDTFGSVYRIDNPA